MTVIIQKESEENQELIGACADLKTEGNSFFFSRISRRFSTENWRKRFLISMTFFFESWTYLGKNKYRNDQFLHIISQFVLISCSCNGRTGAWMDGRALFMSIVKNVHTYLINFLSSIYVDLSKTWLVIYKISISITNMCFYL